MASIDRKVSVVNVGTTRKRATEEYAEVRLTVPRESVTLSREEAWQVIEGLEEAINIIEMEPDDYLEWNKPPSSRPDVTPEEQGEAAAEAAHSNTVD